jgi:DNA-binding transcriptional LysR family regulator
MLRLTLDALQVLDAIARRGSFAAAAEELHRTTSTLSYTVKKLEDDLGVTVFDRSGHRAELTEVGRLLLVDGRSVLDAATAVERRVRTLGRGWEAELAIAYNELVPAEALLEAVAAFYAAGHPTRIKLQAEVLGGPWDALIAQRADLALTEIFASGGALDIAHRPLGAVEFVFALAPSHPLAADQEPLKVTAIRRHRIVVVADSARGLPARSSGISGAADVLTVSSLAAKLAAQIAGLGVGFLPRGLAAPALADGRLVERSVSAPKPRVELSVAWHSQEAGPACLWFVERLQRLDPGAG